MCTGVLSADPIIQNPSERGRTYALTGHKNFIISKTRADIKKRPGVKSVLFLISDRSTPKKTVKKTFAVNKSFSAYV